MTIIFFVVLPKIPLFAGSVSKVATCGGTTFGGKQGVCIPESQYCADKIVAGCENTPGSPVCCFDTNTVSAASTEGSTCILTFDTTELKGLIFLAIRYNTVEECRGNCVVTESDRRDLSNPRRFCASDAVLQQRVACLKPTTLAFDTCYPMEQCVTEFGPQPALLQYLDDLFKAVNEGNPLPPEFSNDNVKCFCVYHNRCS